MSLSRNPTFTIAENSAPFALTGGFISLFTSDNARTGHTGQVVINSQVRNFSLSSQYSRHRIFLAAISNNKLHPLDAAKTSLDYTRTVSTKISLMREGMLIDSFPFPATVPAAQGIQSTTDKTTPVDRWGNTVSPLGIQSGDDGTWLASFSGPGGAGNQTYHSIAAFQPPIIAVCPPLSGFANLGGTATPPRGTEILSGFLAAPIVGNSPTTFPDWNGFAVGFFDLPLFREYGTRADSIRMEIANPGGNWQIVKDQTGTISPIASYSNLWGFCFALVVSSN